MNTTINTCLVFYFYFILFIPFYVSVYSHELKTDMKTSIWRSSVLNSGFDMRYIHPDKQHIQLYQIKNYMKYYHYLQQLNKYREQSSTFTTVDNNDENSNTMMRSFQLAENVLEELYYNPCSRSKYTTDLFRGIQNDFEQ